MSITPGPIARLGTVIRMAYANELTQQAAAERVAGLLASWGLTEGELNAAIDHRVRLLQEQRRELDNRAAALTYIRDRALAIYKSKQGAPA
jgi:hypothetical protein